MSTRRLSRAWRNAPVDPDPKRDLGCEAVDLEIVRQSSGAGEHVVVLPGAEDEMLREEAFIVADLGAVADLDGMC